MIALRALSMGLPDVNSGRFLFNLSNYNPLLESTNKDGFSEGHNMLHCHIRKYIPEGSTTAFT